MWARCICPHLTSILFTDLESRIWLQMLWEGHLYKKKRRVQGNHKQLSTLSTVGQCIFSATSAISQLGDNIDDSARNTYTSVTLEEWILETNKEDPLQKVIEAVRQREAPSLEERKSLPQILIHIWDGTLSYTWRITEYNCIENF